MARSRRHAPDGRARAMQMVRADGAEPPSLWAPSAGPSLNGNTDAVGAARGRTRTRACVVLLLLSVWACDGGGTVTPTPRTSSLSGRVTNGATSTGISGATVSIVDGANAGTSATTDATGHYAFTGLQPADVTVTATSSGYAVSSKIVTLTSNQTLDFTLVQSFAGNWTGTSTRAGDAARRLRFTVNSANVLTVLNASFAPPDCGGYGIDFAVASATPIAITNRSFASTYTPSFTPGATYAFTFTTATITGTFGTGSTASGTVTVQDYVQPVPAGCSGGTISLDWTATKP